jgi:hypothetical protein
MPPVTVKGVPQTKWLRQFWMQVQGEKRTFQIQSPLTLELDVQRSGTQGFGRFTLKIYNLSADTRSDLYRDICNQFTPRSITLNAGYASWQSGYGPQTPRAFPTIASGFIKQCYSTRVGPSWLTVISGWDGGYAQSNANINAPWESNSWNGRIKQLANAMMQFGDISSVYIAPELTANVSRGGVANGKAWDYLSELAQGANADLFVDLGKLYMVPKGKSVPFLTGGIKEISARTGLLNTPIKQQFRVAFDMVFEPQFLVGQEFNLISEVGVNCGSYAIRDIHHFGVISDGVSGDLTTSITSWNQDAKPEGVMG